MEQTWKPNEKIARRGCRFVFIPDSCVYTSNDRDSVEEYSDLKDCVEDALPLSFKWHGDITEDAVVVGKNGHFAVYLTRSAGWATVLVIAVREDAPAFAKGRLSYVADAIFRKVAKRYELMVMNGKRVLKWKGEGQ